MIDLRTHVAALAAVFIALALGMLIGSTRGGATLTRWQDAAVAQLENEFAHQRARQGGQAAALVAARARLASDAAFARAALPWLVRGRLAGRSVTVVAAAGSPLGRQLASVLAQAGAHTALAPLASPAGIRGVAVVVVDGQRQLAAASSWLRSLRAAGVAVTGAEPQTAAPVADALFSRYGVSFVDDAEEPEGQAAIVLLLAGASGHYGREPSALAPLPAAP